MRRRTLVEGNLLDLDISFFRVNRVPDADVKMDQVVTMNLDHSLRPYYLFKEGTSPDGVKKYLLVTKREFKFNAVLVSF